jgi:hypothetical protein
MFDFSQNNDDHGNQGNPLILDPNTGKPVSQNRNQP